VYDAVTAWAVLEHVHAPMEYFQKAGRVTKPGGLFVFLVPNYGSVASRRLFWEDVPRHLNFFTRATVEKYLEKSGFSLVRQVNGLKIHKASPHNWLGYILRTKLLGKGYEFKDMPLTSKEFRRLRGLKGGLVTALRYAAYSPLSVIDRMLWPVTETMQILRKTYGINTFVARKS
jgi:SAM-dependent methyltransferase